MSNQAQNLKGTTASQIARTLIRPWPLIAATLVVFTIAALLIAYADKTIAFFMADIIDKPMLALWRDITKAGDSWPYFAIALTLFFGGRALMLWTAPHTVAKLYDNWARLGLFILICLSSSGLVVHGIKRGLGRVRPKHLLSDNEYGFTYLTSDWTYNSFPSGHSQTAFAVATILCLFAPRYWWAFLSGAAIIAFSRVIINAHFLSDVIVGSFIGLVAVLLIQQRWFPDINHLHYCPSRFMAEDETGRHDS